MSKTSDHKPLPGHWLLASLGKKVLRPGGRELTERMLRAAQPASDDKIVEFGPGVGKTAQLLLSARPAAYVGLDPHPEGNDAMRTIIENVDQARLVTADARDTGLDNNSATLIVGEAMLTMQSEKGKEAIIAEAFRVLAPGGRYAIHELGLRPDDVPDSVEEDIRRSLSKAIRVGARPLTDHHWRTLLESAGFTVSYSDSNPMKLLDPSRIFADEGVLGALKFFFNVARNKSARDRLRLMRAVFSKHREYLCAFAYVAEKPGDALQDTRL